MTRSATRSALVETPCPAAAFVAATIRLYDAQVLIVIVSTATLASPDESRLVIDALARRSGCVVVLVARDGDGVPTYFGPEPIARVLAAIPFDALAWRSYRKRPPPVRLPIPTEPELPTESSDPQPPPGVATRVIRK